MAHFSHSDETIDASGWPDRSSRAVFCALCALVNLPVLILLGWLFATWFTTPATVPSPLLGIGLAAGLLPAWLGGVLLLGRLYRSGRECEETRADAAAQGEQLRCVIESLPDPVLTIDEAGLIRSCNAAGQRLFGYRPGELLGKRLAVLLPDDVTNRTQEVKTDEQRTLGAGRTIEARRKDGSQFPAALTVGKIRPHEDALFIVLVRDLTEINQTRHAAEAADRSKHSFLGRVSHELRTPLGGILGMAEVLRDTPLSREQSCRLDTIQESAESLLVTVDQMIDHARLEAGQLKLAPQPFSLRQLVEQTLAPLASLAGAKGIHLDVRLDDEVPDHFHGDPVRLGQILSNLVGNAIKFTPRGEIVVRVQSEQSSVISDQSSVNSTDRQSGASSLITDHCFLITDHCSLITDHCSLFTDPSKRITLHFEISDTGIGIPPEQAARIFEPFEQADNSVTRKYGGVGLGLTVASQLADLMGGRIEVDSRAGKGSTFRFHLGLETAPAPATPRSVLIVMSRADECLALEQQLTRWGIPSTGVRSGRAALTELLGAVVQGNSFALVLIEEHLPDLSAREILQRLRHRSDCPPPALLLGHTENDLPLPDGVCAVLPRDLPAEQLYPVVLRAMHGRHPIVI
jgi:PAS domain S-box-containing protein